MPDDPRHRRLIHRAAAVVIAAALAGLAACGPGDGGGYITQQRHAQPADNRATSE